MSEGLDKASLRRFADLKAGIVNALPRLFRSDRILNELRDNGLLMYFAEAVEKRRSLSCEADSWKALEALQKQALEMCTGCFTTSQDGAQDSTPETKKDPKYDSIYYLYQLSNGTSLCQRFKRMNIVSKGLAGVVQPIAPLCLFNGSQGDGVDIKAGTYPFSALSLVPKIGFNIYEYFPDSFGVALPEQGGDSRVPDDVEVRPDGVFIRRDINRDPGSYVDIHEGGRVNSIIK